MGNTGKMTHADVISIMREKKGVQLVAQMVKELRPWREGPFVDEDIMSYSCFSEYDLGPCGADKETGRIDAALLVRPFFYTGCINDSFCSIAAEIKCSLKDLNRDNKLDGKYFASGMFDYYFLITPDDNIARKACEKYAGNKAIGVASLSGRIFKYPVKQYVKPTIRHLFLKEVYTRYLLGTSDGNVKYRDYYLADADTYTINLSCAEQIPRTVRLVDNPVWSIRHVE